MFWAEIWKISDFFIWKVSFLVVKFSIYLNRRVFVMHLATFVRFPPFLKGDKFCDFLFAFRNTKALLKKGLLLKERIWSSFFLEKILFQKENDSVKRRAYLLSQRLIKIEWMFLPKPMQRMCIYIQSNFNGSYVFRTMEICFRNR